jgi:salicylate hydroxylase
LSAARTVVIAGAGIGGLTAALALAQRNVRTTILEQSERLDAIGAGIQLSPNASRVLINLGLAEQLKPHVVAPEQLKVMNARSGRVLASAPLGARIAERFGAPYWVVHRGDLHAVLSEAVASHPLVSLQLGARVTDFAAHSNGVTVAGMRGNQPFETQGDVLIGADGLWSQLRERLGHSVAPRFAHYTAWRALVRAGDLSPEFREPTVSLWLGRQAHLVHYPVSAGDLVNVVAIVRDRWRESGWNARGERTEILARFPAAMWRQPARDLIAAVDQWHKWALYDCTPIEHWGQGPVTLLGDAAHPMLPYIAQGAAMAIEDAAVLAQYLSQSPDDVSAVLRRYEDSRHRRTARAQRASRRNGNIYHMGGAEAFLRTLAILAMRGSGLLRRYRWIYRWKPD